MSEKLDSRAWPLARFGDFAEFRNGLNFTRGGSQPAVRIVGVGDFQQKVSLKTVHQLPFVRPTTALNDDDMLRNGDLLFVRSNGNKALIGRCMSIDISEDQPVTFSGFTIRARVVHTRLSRLFAKHLVRSPLFAKRLHLEGGGTNISNLSQGTLSDFVFPLPPLAEQRRISAVLDTWDEAIATTEGLITAKRRKFDYLRAVVLTGRVRLPGFTGDWVTAPLSDVLTEPGLLSTGQEEVFSVSVHRGLVNQVEHLGRSFAASSTGHYRRVRPGDVVYTKSPTGDFPLGIIKQSKVDREVIVSPLYGVFTPESRALGAILDAYFSAPSAAQSYLAPLVQKGAKNTIAVTNDRFLEGSLRLPRDRSEQEALATLVSVALTELDQLSALADRLRLQKRGLMQKLLTGAWRVPSSADALMRSGRLVPEAAE